MVKEISATPALSIVVPVYNEEANVRPFLERLEAALADSVSSYEVLFCLDPCSDRTEQVIQDEIKRNPAIKLLVFSRRFGQPAATMAGILHCNGDACCVIDVDLQDPPELIPALYAKMVEGFDVVYAQRRSRAGETVLKRLISHIGYAVIARLSDVDIPRNTGDFRMMSRRVIEELRQLNETHGFLRGLVAFVGYPQAAIQYDRDPRFGGAGKYNRITGSLKIGLNGLISFSTRPLQLMSIAGASIAGVSFLIGIWYVVQRMLGIDLSAGLPTMVLLVTFFAGVQLLCLGLIGEYIGRIYDEVKRRPMYIILKKVNFEH